MGGWSGDVARTTEGTGDCFLLGLSVRPATGREEGETAGLLLGASEGSVDRCRVGLVLGTDVGTVVGDVTGKKMAVQMVRRWALLLETSQERPTAVMMVRRSILRLDMLKEQPPTAAFLH